MGRLDGKQILLIISGGIAAFKALELIRLLRGAGGAVRCIVTEGGAKFVTPLSAAALSGSPVYTDLWSLKDEAEMGHIRLAREADLIVAAPASANFIASMACGAAHDLARAAILASERPVLIAPAMNPAMWNNPATQHNMKVLRGRGILTVGPEVGETACGETGTGRMAEPGAILETVCGIFGNSRQTDGLNGLHALVTSGPTFEPIDPVRFIGNRSSGKQGHAIARALAGRGARVTLVSGPVALPDPPGVHVVHTETAAQMLEACLGALPAAIAVCAAAVADWAPADLAAGKIKKRAGAAPPSLALRETPDILATLSRPGPNRPQLVAGFAAETDDLLTHAADKRRRKGCDWVLANAVDGGKVFGAEENHVYLISEDGTEEWARAGKQAVADRLAEKICLYFANFREEI